MKYVLDSNVALKWVLNEADSAKARALRDNYQKQIDELITVDFFPLECAHGLAKAQRRGIVPDAEALWLDLMIDCPQLLPSLPLTHAALKLAEKAHVGVYDCLFIALAEQEGCPLITADQRLVNSLQGTYSLIVHLANL